MTALITEQLHKLAADKAADDIRQGERAQDFLMKLGDFGNQSQRWRQHVEATVQQSLEHVRNTLHAEVDSKIDGVIKEVFNLLADFDHANQQQIINLIRATQDLQQQYVR